MGGGELHIYDTFLDIFKLTIFCQDVYLLIIIILADLRKHAKLCLNMGNAGTVCDSCASANDGRSERALICKV